MLKNGSPVFRKWFCTKYLANTETRKNKNADLLTKINLSLHVWSRKEFTKELLNLYFPSVRHEVTCYYSKIYQIRHCKSLLSWHLIHKYYKHISLLFRYKKYSPITAFLWTVIPFTYEKKWKYSEDLPDNIKVLNWYKYSSLKIFFHDCPVDSLFNLAGTYSSI